MYIASYARKGRGNQLVLEFTDSELDALSGCRYLISQTQDSLGRRIYFDEAALDNEARQTLTKRMLISSNFPVFGKTPVSITKDADADGGSTYIQLPVILKPVRKRRAKVAVRYPLLSRVMKLWPFRLAA